MDLSIEPVGKTPLKRREELKDEFKFTPAPVKKAQKETESPKLDLCKGDKVYPNTQSIIDLFNQITDLGLKKTFVHDLIQRSSPETLMFLLSPLGGGFVWAALKDVFGLQSENIHAIVYSCLLDKEDRVNLPGVYGRFAFLTSKENRKISVPVYVKMNSMERINVYDFTSSGELKLHDPFFDPKAQDLIISDPLTNLIHIKQLLENESDQEERLEVYQRFSIIEKIVTVYSMVDPGFISVPSE